MRKDGAIPQLKNERFPSRILVFDTEAFRGDVINGLEVQTFRLAVTRYVQLNKHLDVLKDQLEKHDNVTTLYQTIERNTRKDKCLYVYAHNVKYDLQLSGLLTLFLENGWKVGVFVFDDPPTFIRLSRNRSSIMFVDTFNYWQTSLAKMGEQLGSAKLKTPVDTETLENWYTYCIQDVNLLTNYVLSYMRYLKNNDLCGMGLTLASQAFRTFRHRFMSCPIQLHNRPEVMTLERQGYSGGRVEAFVIGSALDQPYYKLDVNSMYPFVMLNEVYPCELVGYSENIDVSRLQSLMDRYYIIAEVQLKTTQPAYPYKLKHKLVFPIGDYTTVLHQSELIHALSNGYIQSIPRASAYHKGDVFSEYIRYFYQMKVQAEVDHNPIIRHQSKIMMNSLYGKFGQMEVYSQILPNTTNLQYGRLTGYSESLGRRVEVNVLGSEMEVSYKEGESMYSFPGIAGAVTAYARMYLYHLIQTAGIENTFYCDTDSLIVNQAGVDNLSPFIDPVELGKLKIEGVSNTLVVWGAKDYIFSDEVKHKGVPKSARELSTGVWEYEQFRGAKSWLTDGLQPNVNVYTRIKQRKSAYDKGIIQPSGIVSPIILRGL